MHGASRMPLILLAIGALRAAIDEGLSLPEDVAVIGIDDVEVSVRASIAQRDLAGHAVHRSRVSS